MAPGPAPQQGFGGDLPPAYAPAPAYVPQPSGVDEFADIMLPSSVWVVAKKRVFGLGRGVLALHQGDLIRVTNQANGSNWVGELSDGTSGTFSPKGVERATPEETMRLAQSLEASRSDPKLAAWYMRASAEMGNPNAMRSFGMLLLKGGGGLRDKKEDAFLFLMSAAKCGMSDTELCRAISKCFERGIGTAKNPRAAMAWIEKCIGNGDHEALNEVGTMLMADPAAIDQMGRGFQYLMRAAETGSPMGCFNVGNCFFFGYGAESDMNEGMSWWSKGRSLADKMPNDNWMRHVCNGRVLPLSDLDLARVPLGVTGAMAISLIMASSPSLTSVNLESCHIGPKGAPFIARGLRETKSLTRCILYGNVFGAEGAEHLARALQLNKTLTYLDLSGNMFMAKGCCSIANALRGHPTLVDFNILSNYIDDDGRSACMSLKASNPRIVYLSF